MGSILWLDHCDDNYKEDLQDVNAFKKTFFRITFTYLGNLTRH